MPHCCIFYGSDARWLNTAMLIITQRPLIHRRPWRGVALLPTGTAHNHRQSHQQHLHLCTPSARARVTQAAMASQPLRVGQELDETFTGLADADGLMSVAGFGSLLSETSARTTFPNLINFRLARVRHATAGIRRSTPLSPQLRGYRRVFANCADIFFSRYPWKQHALPWHSRGHTVPQLTHQQGHCQPQH